MKRGKKKPEGPVKKLSKGRKKRGGWGRLTRFMGEPNKDVVWEGGQGGEVGRRMQPSLTQKRGKEARVFNCAEEQGKGKGSVYRVLR